MKKFIISEDTEVVLDGEIYLLEKGDKITIGESADDVSVEDHLSHYFGGDWRIIDGQVAGTRVDIDYYHDSGVVGSNVRVPASFRKTFAVMNFDPGSETFVDEEGNYSAKLDKLPRLKDMVINAVKNNLNRRKSAMSSKPDIESEPDMESENYW